MASGIFIWFSILSFIVVALLVVLAMIYFSRKEEDYFAPFVLNFMSNRADGHFFGREKSVTVGKNGRMLCEFSPKDYSPKSLRDGNSKITTETVIVGKNKRLIFPRAVVSKEQDIAVYLASHPSDYPDEFKQTILGKAFMWATELQNLVDLEVKLLKEGTSRRDDILTRMGDGEATRAFLKFTEELAQDALKSATANKDKDKAPTLPYGPAGGQQQSHE